MLSKVAAFQASWALCKPEPKDVVVWAEPSVPATTQGDGASGTKVSQSAHIYFLLDRSGSMHHIADDVIGGFNAFVKEQQGMKSEGAPLNMTLVQFDSKDPHEVVFSALDIDDVPLLTGSTFQPRAMTPLFDALGSVISMAEAAKNAHEHIVVVAFSDGHENASREHSKKGVFSRINTKRQEGWAFVFLGACQDSYAEGGSLGIKTANIQNFAFDGKGVRAAWQAVSGAAMMQRSNLQRGKSYDHEDYFEGVKIAEEDYAARKS